MPLLRRQRHCNSSQPGATATEIYSRYLRLPPWPMAWLLQTAFVLEQAPALDGALSTGTSLFAVGRKLA